MKKIKLAILMYSMDCGGIEKAITSILRNLPLNIFDITLILNKKRGAFLNLVPTGVKIEELATNDDYKRHISMGDKRWLVYSFSHCKFKSFFKTFLYIIKCIFSSREKKAILKAELMASDISFTKEYFDYIFAYSNIEQLYYAIYYYNKKHIAHWLHREIDINREDCRKYLFLYEKCDRIFGVSQKVVDAFLGYLPTLKDKLYTHKNLIDEKLGIALAEEYIVKRPLNKLYFLTVCRMTAQKGVDIIPDIALHLKNSGIQFVWTIVGDGFLKEQTINRVKELKLEDCLDIVGEKPNPYPYFKACDIYLQPSRYEGYCITVAEARIFHKPIIATNFAGANEQLENGKCGKVVEFGVESFANAILEVVSSKQLQEQFIKGLYKQKIDTTDTINIIIEYMEKNI